eukprot:jgi/Mesvir1/5875/Mv00653-RA.1
MDHDSDSGDNSPGGQDKGRSLLGFLFGNVDEDMRLDADYLDEDAKAHLDFLGSVTETLDSVRDLGGKIASAAGDVDDRDYVVKAADAVDYEDYDELADEVDSALEVGQAQDFYAKAALAGPQTVGISGGDDLDFDEDEDEDDGKTDLAKDKPALIAPASNFAPIPTAPSDTAEVKSRPGKRGPSVAFLATWSKTADSTEVGLSRPHDAGALPGGAPPRASGDLSASQALPSGPGDSSKHTASLAQVPAEEGPPKRTFHDIIPENFPELGRMGGERILRFSELFSSYHQAPRQTTARSRGSRKHAAAAGVLLPSATAPPEEAPGSAAWSDDDEVAVLQTWAVEHRAIGCRQVDGGEGEGVMGASRTGGAESLQGGSLAYLSHDAGLDGSKLPAALRGPTGSLDGGLAVGEREAAAVASEDTGHPGLLAPQGLLARGEDEMEDYGAVDEDVWETEESEEGVKELEKELEEAEKEEEERSLAQRENWRRRAREGLGGDAEPLCAGMSPLEALGRVPVSNFLPLNTSDWEQGIVWGDQDGEGGEGEGGRGGKRAGVEEIEEGEGGSSLQGCAMEPTGAYASKYHGGGRTGASEGSQGMWGDSSLWGGMGDGPRGHVGGISLGDAGCGVSSKGHAGAATHAGLPAVGGPVTAGVRPGGMPGVRVPPPTIIKVMGKSKGAGRRRPGRSLADGALGLQGRDPRSGKVAASVNAANGDVGGGPSSALPQRALALALDPESGLVNGTGGARDRHADGRESYRDDGDDVDDWEAVAVHGRVPWGLNTGAGEGSRRRLLGARTRHARKKISIRIPRVRTHPGGGPYGEAGYYSNAKPAAVSVSNGLVGGSLEGALPRSSTPAAMGANGGPTALVPGPPKPLRGRAGAAAIPRPPSRLGLDASATVASAAAPVEKAAARTLHPQVLRLDQVDPARLREGSERDAAQPGRELWGGGWEGSEMAALGLSTLLKSQKGRGRADASDAGAGTAGAAPGAEGAGMGVGAGVGESVETRWLLLLARRRNRDLMGDDWLRALWWSTQGGGGGGDSVDRSGGGERTSWGPSAGGKPARKLTKGKLDGGEENVCVPGGSVCKRHGWEMQGAAARSSPGGGITASGGVASASGKKKGARQPRPLPLGRGGFLPSDNMPVWQGPSCCWASGGEGKAVCRPPCVLCEEVAPGGDVSGSADVRADLLTGSRLGVIGLGEGPPVSKGPVFERGRDHLKSGDARVVEEPERSPAHNLSLEPRLLLDLNDSCMEFVADDTPEARAAAAGAEAWVRFVPRAHHAGRGSDGAAVATTAKGGDHGGATAVGGVEPDGHVLAATAPPRLGHLPAATGGAAVTHVSAALAATTWDERSPAALLLVHGPGGASTATGDGALSVPAGDGQDRHEGHPVPGGEHGGGAGPAAAAAPLPPVLAEAAAFLSGLNLSLDKLYQGGGGARRPNKVAKRIGPRINHSVPALKLETCTPSLSSEARRHFHRPRAQFAPKGAERPHSPRSAGAGSSNSEAALAAMRVDITVRTMLKKTFSCSLRGSDTVHVLCRDVVKEWKELAGTPIRLFLDGRPLDKSITLGSLAQGAGGAGGVSGVPMLTMYVTAPRLNLLPNAVTAIVPSKKHEGGGGGGGDGVGAGGGKVGKHPPSTYKKKPDLSGMDGQIVLLEHALEHPLFVSNVGMGAQLAGYYAKKTAAESGAAAAAAAARAAGIERAQPMVVLEPSDPSPFLDKMAPGQARMSLETNMFRAPAFEHAVPSTDFLLIRTAKGSLHVRAIQRVCAVGQQEPHMDVFQPGSKPFAGYQNNRLQAHVYRKLLEDEEATKKKKKKKQEVGRDGSGVGGEGKLAEVPGNRPSVLARELEKAFPDQKGILIAKRLKKAFDKQAGKYVLRPGFNLLREDELRRLVSPEQVCLYESMLAGLEQLRVAGLGVPPTSEVSRFRWSSSAIASLGQVIKAHVRGGGRELRMASHLEAALQLTPWNLTSHFLNSLHGRGAMQVTGSGDPTGRGLAVSYVRVPPKDLTLANATEEKAAGRTRGEQMKQAVAAQERMHAILAAQAKALSAREPLPDLGGDGGGARRG